MERKIRCGGRPMTAIVLAGGRGSRMSADKASLDVGGKTLLEHVLAQVALYFDEVLISVSPGQAPPPLPSALRRRAVPDETPGLGPIGGLLAGLKAARNEACAVVACDIPDVDIALLRSLARAARDAEIAVVVDPAGHYEPLFAVYKRSVAGTIETLLDQGERSLLPLYDRHRTAVMPLGEKTRLRNLNTREDYDAYVRSIQGPETERPGAAAGRRNGAVRKREKTRGPVRRAG